MECHKVLTQLWTCHDLLAQGTFTKPAKYSMILKQFLIISKVTSSWGLDSLANCGPVLSELYKYWQRNISTNSKMCVCLSFPKLTLNRMLLFFQTWTEASWKRVWSGLEVSRIAFRSSLIILKHIFVKICIKMVFPFKIFKGLFVHFKIMDFFWN